MKKRKLVAVLKKKYLKSHWGFEFNTQVQSYVENFMLSIHVSDSDYWLCWDNDKPKGVYTSVKISPKLYPDGSLQQLTFKIK